jgi:nicotinate-nucleotide adenylyltransferase
MRVAVYGGSFNPPHIGHAMVVQWILWTDKADRVLLVPSGQHPHGKSHSHTLDERMLLLRAMAQDIDPVGVSPTTKRILVSNIESEWNGPVYTYDLLTRLREQNPDWRIRFVIGADILGETHRWHKWDRVREEFPLLVLGREGYPSPDGNPIIPGYSSSGLRAALETGDDRWRSMVTPGVRRLLDR